MVELARSAKGMLATASLLAVTLGLGGCALFERREDGGSSAGSPTSSADPSPVPRPGPRVYDVNQPSVDDPLLVLQRVTVEPTGTRLDFHIKSGSRRLTIAASPPGSERAMFIETPDGKKVPVREILGISTIPVRDSLAPGEDQSFTLVFAPLDPGVVTFNVYEGEESRNAAERRKKETDLWVFEEVKLEEGSRARDAAEPDPPRDDPGPGVRGS